MPLVATRASAAYGAGFGKVLGSSFTPSTAFYAIGSAVFTSNAASATFSDIPSDFTHLQVRMTTLTTDTGGSNVYARFNGDSGSNYSWHEVYSYNTLSIAGQGALSQTFLKTGYSEDPTAPGNCYFDIMDYGSYDKYKHIRCVIGSNDNTNGYMIFRTGVWNSYAPITSILFYAQSLNIATGSIISLYGIK